MEGIQTHLSMISLPAEMRKIHQMKGLVWSHHISHCKSIWIFTDAQGQLHPQSDVGSGLNLNSVEIYGCPRYLLE